MHICFSGALSCGSHGLMKTDALQWTFCKGNASNRVQLRRVSILPWNGTCCQLRRVFILPSIECSNTDTETIINVFQVVLLPENFISPNRRIFKGTVRSTQRTWSPVSNSAARLRWNPTMAEVTTTGTIIRLPEETLAVTILNHR